MRPRGRAFIIFDFPPGGFSILLAPPNNFKSFARNRPVCSNVSHTPGATISGALERKILININA